MKLARAIAVLTVIVVFPAISWYYLSRGAEWRIRGIEAMKDKVAIELPHTPLVDDNGKIVAGLGTDFIIAVNVDPDEHVADLNKIAELFSHRGDVTFLSFHGGTAELHDAWTVVDCSVSPCGAWTTQLYSDHFNVALIDDSLYVRNAYDLNKHGQMKLLAEHGVILFPVEKHEKIELKRGHNQ